MKCFVFIFALLSCIISSRTNAQPATTGTLVCAKCGHIERNNRAAMLAHTCSRHGLNCPARQTYYPPVATKTPEQIRKEREEKDLQEAAEDANDHGVDFYEKKDWATAINYFKVALEYLPGFEDALYNLKKAEQKLEEEHQLMEVERQRKEKEEEEKQKQFAEQNIQTVTLPPALNKYMEEADKIIVPPPSWESNIEEQVTQIRLGQNGESNLLLANNVLLAAFDQVCTTKGLDLKVKLLLIGAKSGFAALDEAEIVAFRQNAWYERTLQVLKDKKQGSLLIAAIKALRDKKPMPPGITPELEKMAKATQDPSLGNSSVHMAMSVLLSKESKAAFFQTFKMEAIGLISDKISSIVDELKGETREFLEKRISGLKEVNNIIDKGGKLADNISKGIELADKNQGPLFKTMIGNKRNDLERNIQPLKTIPEAIINVMAFFDPAKRADN